MADFFYALRGQQNGPIAAEQLDQMVSSGTLPSDALVWSEGMNDWQPYSAIRTSPRAVPAGGGLSLATPPAATGFVCSVCQQTFPSDQVIRYGPSYVCGGCKPQFLQRLREGAVVSAGLDYAGVGRRFLAKFLDTLVIYAAMFGVQFGLEALAPATPENAIGLALVALAINFAISIGYPIFFLGKWGQTLGKMALKVKVVTPDGGNITYMRATGRVFAEMVTGFTFGIGYIMAAWDAEKRALHDRMAGTRVINVAGDTES